MREAILLIRQAIPEWRDCYIDYNYLKVFISVLTKLINQYIENTQNSEAQSTQHNITPTVSQINKYNQSENSQKIRKKLKQFIDQVNTQFQLAFNQQTKMCQIFCQIQYQLIKCRYQLCLNFKKAQNDEQGKKIKLLIPYAEYTYIEASYLKKMEQSNLQAERKILKKHKKYAQSVIKTPKPNLQKNLQLSKIKRFVNDIQDFYVDFSFSMEENKRKKSKKKLKRDYIRSLTQQIQTSNKDSFIFGLWVGLFMAVILFMSLLLAYQNKGVETNPIFNRDFPTWRGIAFVIFYIWVIGINVFCFQYFMISHRIILDFNQHHYSTSNQIFKIAGSFSTLFAAAFTVYALNLAQIVNLGGFPPKYLVLIPWATFLLFMANPFPIFYAKTRLFLFKTLIKIILSPIVGVVFMTTWATDQLVSLLTPFQDLIYTVCYFTSLDFADVQVLNNNCKYPAKLGVFIFGIIVFSYRIMQCMKQGWDKRKYLWEPQFFNTLKYLFSLFTLIFSYMWQSGSQNLFAAWLTFAISSTIYSYSWDLKVDWALLNRKATNFLLRDKLLYSPKSYYVMMISNLALRLAWVLTLSPNISNNFFGSPQIFRLLTGALQILRRGIWNLLRMEKQQLKNSQEFKAIPGIRFTIEKKIQIYLNKISNSLSAKQMVQKQNQNQFKDMEMEPPQSRQELICNSEQRKQRIKDLTQLHIKIKQIQKRKKEIVKKMHFIEKQADILIKQMNQIRI